jgi:hypothetical protein
MNITWLEKEDLLPTVIKKLKKIEVVLDIGCGIRPQQYIKPLVHICCEPFKQYVAQLLNKIKNEYDRNYVIIKATWSEAVRIFPPKSVDTVFLLDVIEHLIKEEAIDLLKKTENIARQQIVIFTPLGFMPQEHSDGKDGWGLDGGKWQEHKSGWQPEDFGDEWDIYASKIFHTVDSMMKPIEMPFGAFWAIRNHPYKKSYTIAMSKRQKIHFLIDKALDIFVK